MTSDKVSILIVEDESLIALDLSAGLQRDGYHIAGIADHEAGALAIFQQEEVDLVLMDIHLHGEADGVDTARELLSIRPVPIVYLTALTDDRTIDRVKATHPAAFLTKPYNMAGVRIAIELALANFTAAKEQQQGAASVISVNSKTGSTSPTDTILQLENNIYVKNSVRFVKIALQDILYFEADNNYVNLLTGDQRLALRISLAQLLEKINSNKLVRIHRSYAVNMDKITSFSDAEIWLDKIQLPLGRNHREEFFNRFGPRPAQPQR
jgi:DNA-binding LytR/AlgR family response regulator